MTDLTRLIRLGHAFLAADRDVERLRQSCVRNRMTDAMTAHLMATRRGLLFGPLRAQIDGDPLHMDDLAYLRALQEIARILDDNLPLDVGHWGEVAGRLDDVISAVDEALTEEERRKGRAAA